MFGVFRYTFKKLVYKSSTLFITLFAIFIMFLVGVSIHGRTSQFAYLAVDIVGSIGSSTIIPFYQMIVWLLLPILCGLKSIIFIADEIEDGSFLTIISKPVSRTKILIEKFVAYELFMFLWTMAIVSVTWVFILGYYPYLITFEFFNATFFTMIFIIFILQIILSIILIVLSLKLKPGVIIGVAGFFGLFSQIGSRLIQTNIVNNSKYQAAAGREVTEDDYKKMSSGQQTYNSILKYFDYSSHFAEIYYANFQPIYEKYNAEATLAQYYNRRVIVAQSKKVEKNELGKQVFKDFYFVKDYENWHNRSFLIYVYIFITILAVGLGFLYFSRKDII